MSLSRDDPETFDLLSKPDEAEMDEYYQIEAELADVLKRHKRKLSWLMKMKKRVAEYLPPEGVEKYGHTFTAQEKTAFISQGNPTTFKYKTTKVE